MKENNMDAAGVKKDLGQKADGEGGAMTALIVCGVLALIVIVGLVIWKAKNRNPSASGAYEDASKLAPPPVMA